MRSRESLSIFIVDDDPLCRTLYEHAIRTLGYHQIKLFSDGQDCLNHLTEQPDVVFLDYHMEPLDGLGVLRKIKRFSPDIFLVVISGQADMQVAVNALKYGAFDYLIKGQNDLAKIEAVLKKIQHVLARLQQRPRGRWGRIMNLIGGA